MNDEQAKRLGITLTLAENMERGGWKRKDIAKAVGVTPSTLSHILSGEGRYAENISCQFVMSLQYTYSRWRIWDDIEQVIREEIPDSQFRTLVYRNKREIGRRLGVTRVSIRNWWKGDTPIRRMTKQAVTYSMREE